MHDDKLFGKISTSLSSASSSLHTPVTIINDHAAVAETGRHGQDDSGVLMQVQELRQGMQEFIQPTLFQTMP